MSTSTKTVHCSDGGWQQVCRICSGSGEVPDGTSGLDFQTGYWEGTEQCDACEGDGINRDAPAEPDERAEAEAMERDR